MVFGDRALGSKLVTVFSFSCSCGATTEADDVGPLEGDWREQELREGGRWGLWLEPDQHAKCVRVLRPFLGLTARDALQSVRSGLSGTREEMKRFAHALREAGASAHVFGVRKESPADIDAIRVLLAASFPTRAEAALVDALRAAGRLAISLVAVEEDEVIGHVGFSPITIDGELSGLGLAPVAVRVDCRRRGVAARLVGDGLSLCREAGTRLVVVLGEPAYYSRFAFEPGSRFALRDEYEGGDAFQAIELVRGAVPAEGGLVRYSREFAGVGV